MREPSGSFIILERMHNQISSNYGDIMMIMMSLMIASSVLFTAENVSGLKTNRAFFYNPNNESLIKQ
jgi:hypothetical protein